MKKILLSTVGFAVMTSSASSLTSCIKASYATGEDGQRIMVVTGPGNIYDKSFNQSAWQAMNEFTKTRYIDQNGQPKFDSTNNWVEATDTTTTGLMRAYKLGLYKKANAFVLAGFVHLGAIELLSKLIGSEKSIVLADAMVDYSNNKNKNIISLQYNAELAGFAAAFDAAIWATSKDENGHFLGDANKDGRISFGNFGGISSKFGVDSYSWGFLVGIQTFNQIAIAKDQTERKISFANVKSGNVEDIGVVESGDSAWYSNSFFLGGAEASGIITNLFANQADVILGVAGPQIQDILSHRGNYQPYVIGVDVDQVEVYLDYKERFISSATKNLVGSIKEALAHAKALKLNNGQTIDDNEVWDGTIPQPKSDWSYNKVGGKNILQKSAINFETAHKGDEIDQIGQVLKQHYSALGSNTQDYFNTEQIKKIAQDLVNTHQQLLKSKLDLNLLIFD